MKAKTLAVLAALLVAGCGGAGDPPAQPSASAPGTSAERAAPEAPQSTARQAPAEQSAQQAVAPPAAEQTPAQQAAQEPPAQQAPAQQVAQERPQRAAAGNARFREGVHYQRLSPAQPTSTEPGQVEVTDVFMYGCPACFAFEPYMTQWKRNVAEDVNVVPVPALFDRLARLHAQAYYTADALGKLDEMHTAFFREIHVNGNRLDSEAALASFFGRFGVDEETFKSTFNSFAVHTRTQRADELVRRYRVSGTPTVVVNGKYVTTGAMAGSYETWFEIIEELVAAERPESGG